MKKGLFKLTPIVLYILLFSSCVTQQLTDRQEETKTFAIDFRKYAERGFLFMPDEYYGEYEVMGIIRAELHPEVRYRDGAIPAGPGYSIHQFYVEGNTFTQITNAVNIDELINHIYELAIEWGGDAFTHFESSIEVGRTDDSPNTTYAYYSISGIVIKRK